MKTFSCLCLALLICSTAKPATIPSAQSGIWSATTTWTGGVVPSPGVDIAQASTGTKVTIDVNVSPGASGVNGTNALICAGTGQFEVSAGITVDARGDIQVHAGNGANPCMIFDGG